jgi:hypothetical protein
VRVTLYSEHNGIEELECVVVAEVHWQPDELATALKRGSVSVQQVTETLARGVSAISKILTEFENSR